MGALNRRRYAIAGLITALTQRATGQPHDPAVAACLRAGLPHRLVREPGGGYVAVSCHPSVGFMAFVAIEPACYRSPDRSGWRLWWEHRSGLRMFREGDPVEEGQWYPTLTEALAVVARWAHPQDLD